MSSPDNVESFDPNADSSSAVAKNVGLLAEIAKSFRRLKANEDFDGRGVRTIWHRGTMRSEMLTWEDKGGSIVKQELSFLGMVVEFKQNEPLRTGTIPLNQELTDAGKPMSHLLKMDRAPVEKTLDYASVLLKNVPDRDYYAQHLLKHVNDTIASLGMDDSRTVIAKLDNFTRSQNAQKSEPEITRVARHPARSTNSGFSTLLRQMFLPLARIFTRK